MCPARSRQKNENDLYKGLAGQQLVCVVVEVGGKCVRWLRVRGARYCAHYYTDLHYNTYPLYYSKETPPKKAISWQEQRVQH